MSRTYFIDRDLGRHVLPEVLESAGLRVERHHDHFAHDAPDEEWLPAVAERAWIVLTGDKRLLRRPLEIAAIRNSRAIVLILVGNDAPAKELAQNFVNTLRKIEETLATMSGPAVAKVYRPSPRERVFEGVAGSIEVRSLPGR